MADTKISELDAAATLDGSELVPIVQDSATVAATLDDIAALSGTTERTLGYAQVTANQASIGSSDTDLTGLSVTVDVPSGARIRITGYAIFQQLSAGGLGFLLLKESSTLLNEDIESKLDTNYRTAKVMAVLTPSAGSHTYKLAAKTTAGTLTMEAAATFPAWILVEDIT